jgi:hypothetical protein
MVRITPIRKLLPAVMLVIASSAAVAQYSNYEPPRWRVNGFAGVDLTHTSQSQINQDGQTGQMAPLGDLRLNSDGFLLDPRFLHLNAGLDYQKGTNSSDRGDLGVGGMNIAVGTAFLPNSHQPLRFSYTRTDHGVTGLGLDQNDDSSRIDVQWNVSRPNLPHIITSFQDYSSTVHVATSFADRSFSQKAFNVGASDVWKDWHWAGNYSIGNGNSTGASQIGIDSSFDNSTRAGGFNLSRGFWDNKARLLFENRDVWRDDHLVGDGTSKSSELTNNLNFDLQVHPKVLLSAGYGFAKVDFQGNGFDNVLVPGAGNIQVVALNSSTSNTGSGRVSYRPWYWLHLSQEVRTTFSSPADGLLESRTSYTDTASTLSADHHWRSFDFMGAYTGRFQVSGTTLNNSPDSWSNSYMGRIGWGDVRNLRLTASGENTRLNLVEQIGGFTDQKRIGAEAETHRVKYFRLRASGDHSEVELLNLSGSTRTRMTTYALAAEHRRFTVAFTSSYMKGAGALFPLGLIDQQFLVIPLPISQLLATPLLDRTTRSKGVMFLGRPRRHLEVAVNWRAEDTQLPESDQTYDVLQADARYHIGKFTLEGGYSRNLNEVTVITGLNGNRLAIWYFRIGRDFKIL